MENTKFYITENAAKRIAFLSEKEAGEAMLRVAVDGGGCSGFQYKYEFVTAKNSDDTVLEKDGAVVIIDETSLDFVKGSALDYIEDLSGAFFEIKNPNATASCGCGNSFAV